MLWAEESFEKAEQKMFERAVELAIHHANLQKEDVDFMVGGDLLNQIISAGFTARNLGIPFLGVYGACSTMAESLAIGSMMVGGGFAKNVVCATSSHFATAERQFRYPLELGTPQTTTAQNTATAAGATLISNRGKGPRVTHATIGSVVDMGISDANNMGAAMAPAAAETIYYTSGGYRSYTRLLRFDSDGRFRHIWDRHPQRHHGSAWHRYFKGSFRLRSGDIFRIGYEVRRKRMRMRSVYV